MDRAEPAGARDGAAPALSPIAGLRGTHEPSSLYSFLSLAFPPIHFRLPPLMPSSPQPVFAASGGTVPPASKRAGRFTFFRQSGWMIIATTAGGVLMSAVHKVATLEGHGMPVKEMSIFLALLQVLNQMAIPASGLQMAFAQQTGAANTEQGRRELAGAFRALVSATFVIWLSCAGLVFVFQDRIVTGYKLSN